MENVFSRKNVNLFVGLISLLVILWLVMFFIPSIFINLFDTILGNFILLFFVILAFIYNKLLSLGLAVVFIILYRFSHHYEHFII
jgi:hypothetical protein